MRDYIIRRVLLVIPIMLGVTLLTFGVFRVIPGDVCVTTLGFGATPQTIKDCQKAHGLDKPWYHQYWSWAKGVATGDLGTSLTESDQPVNKELDSRLPVTIELMIMTIILALVLGIPPGVLSAIRPGTPLDWLSRFSSVLWLSIPSFYLGILVITFGAAWFNWTPPQFGKGYIPFMDDPWTNLQEFFFPSLVLAVGISAVIMRLTRSSMLEVMRNDYIRTAWSKGLRERTVVWRHAVKNALIPVVTLIGLQVGGLLGGAVIVESLFNLNGVGKYTLESILRRDFIVVQSLVLLFAATFVTANLIVDVAYAWLDPRIHYG
ncbi:MAG TPA: ABC transporter permease [Dehalococcoidia bacterium]|nr:ABC transporter permease [Dehalococcoidia bacterium]